MFGNTLFSGVSPTVLAFILAGLTGGVLFILGGLGASNPVLWRMGMRNTMRRPSQTLILLCGLVLSTIVITASFGLSDSFAHSTLTHRLAAMGNVDESVTGPFTQSQLNSALARIRSVGSVQTVTAISFDPQSLTVTSARTGLSIHNVDLYAVPPDFDQVYGPISNIHGQAEHFADLGANQVYVSASIAQNFDVQPGDTLQFNYGDQTITSTVRALLSNDLGVTACEAVEAGDFPEVILPLTRYQQITQQTLVPDTICIKNIGQSGADDSVPGESHSQAVVRLLQQIFPSASASLHVSGALGVTDFDSFRIHPLKPDVVDAVALQLSKPVFLSSAGQQFSWLPSIFTSLLVGASMLLLVLLMILPTERRAELGMSRALGLQRSHLVQLLLFEGCSYSVIASLVGVVLGFGATALELAVLAQVPQLAPGEFGSNALPVPVIESLHVWLSWQSILSAGCLSFLTTLVVVWLTAIWISHTEIVTAIRDLDAAPRGTAQPLQLIRALWTPPLDAVGQPLPETSARRLTRVTGTAGQLLWELWLRGPLCLLAGLLLLTLERSFQQIWLQQVAIALLITSLGFFVTWSGLHARAWKGLARRLGYSLIGLGWLIYGLLSGNAFLALFQPVITYTSPPSAPEILLSMLLLVSGTVVLIMSNADLLVYPLGFLLQRIPRLAPIGRTSLIYPLTFRFRTGVTVALLSLVTFLVLMLVTTNLGAIQEAQAAANSGGFQIEATVFGSQDARYNDLNLQLQGLQAHTVLGQDFTAIGLLRLMYNLPQSGRPAPIHLDMAGQPTYPLSGPPLVADDAFLTGTTMPLYARAQGFSSDQQVWQALREHTGYAVIQYDAQVHELPTGSGFAPFSVEIPDHADIATASYHKVTIIGLMPASTPWRTLMSVRTAGSVVQPPEIQFINTYLFRLRAGRGEAQATSDLNRTLDAARRGINVQSLDQASLNGITAVFTLFLGGYLALGLIFGVLAIGVIASRAVVERRQQIGMLRVLGFSRGLVCSSFLLESSFVIALSLVTGAALALWLAYQVARATYQNFPLPVGPIILILLGSFLIVCISTALPARRAARLHPAEALRYE